MKTLKDLIIRRRGRKRIDTDRTNLYSYIQIGESQDELSPGQLRQSAIEDIKQYQKEIEEIYQTIKSDEHKPTTNLCKICRMGSYDCTCRAKRKSKIEYIKEKFNITEDDLK